MQSLKEKKNIKINVILLCDDIIQMIFQNVEELETMEFVLKQDLRIWGMPKGILNNSLLMSKKTYDNINWELKLIYPELKLKS